MYRNVFQSLILKIAMAPVGLITMAPLVVCVAPIGVCAQTQDKSQSRETTRLSDIREAKIGSTKNVHRDGNLFFSGQFSQEDIGIMREMEFQRIISLRTPGEVDWDEAASVTEAGIKFEVVPFKKPDTLTDEVFSRVRTLLKSSNQKTLLHCGSASRVGGVWLTYRVLDQGVALDQAIEEAETIGLKTPFIKEKALDYIKRQQDEADGMAGEKSVKPGINKSFTNPNLDVDSYVKRFEIESREVYLSRELIVEACEIQEGHTVADVGAGTGLFTRMFSDKVGTDGWIFAVDIAPRFIEHINKDAAAQNRNNITGVLCAENSVNLPPNSVDVVFICDTYHHFEYPKSTMASIFRALKPKGHLILIDFERIPGKTRPWLLNHVRAGKEVFRAEIQDAGFTLAEEKKIEGFEENYFLKFRKD